LLLQLASLMPNQPTAAADDDDVIERQQQYQQRCNRKSDTRINIIAIIVAEQSSPAKQTKG